MATKYEQKEKYHGIFEGEEVSFNKSWSGYEFSDEECEKLLNGETIEIHGLVSKSSGNTYGVTGKLEHYEFDGNKVFGFKRLDFAKPKTAPESFCGHKFTKEELALLNAGKEVFVEGYYSKRTGKNFNANTTFINGELKFKFD